MRLPKARRSGLKLQMAKPLPFPSTPTASSGAADPALFPGELPLWGDPQHLNSCPFVSSELPLYDSHRATGRMMRPLTGSSSLRSSHVLRSGSRPGCPAWDHTQTTGYTCSFCPWCVASQRMRVVGPGVPAWQRRRPHTCGSACFLRPAPLNLQPLHLPSSSSSRVC